MESNCSFFFSLLDFAINLKITNSKCFKKKTKQNTCLRKIQSDGSGRPHSSVERPNGGENINVLGSKYKKEATKTPSVTIN